MALTFSAFTTFAEVENYYNNITPLRGKGNVGKDIRPIGDRGRKHERIVKISPNCYALSDGWHYGGVDHYRTGEYYLAPTLDLMERYAPIVWRKKRDGTELVTLRNGLGEGVHSGRYQFLWRHTPCGMNFRNKNGKHFIATGDGEYFLAKCRTLPRPAYEKVQADAKANPASRHGAQRAAWAMVHDDNASLTFTNVHGKWHWVGGGRGVPAAPKKRVDLAAKARLKPHIEAFRDWVLAIGPMLPIHVPDYAYTLRKEMLEWGKLTATAPRLSGWSLSTMITDALARDIISDPEHPMRIQLAYVAITRAGILNPCEDQEDMKNRKTLFNRWVNKQLGLIKEGKE